MSVDGRHCIDEDKQSRKANALACRAFLQRLREVHGSPALQPEPDIVELVPTLVRKSEATETRAESRFIRYRIDENGRRIPRVEEIKRLVASRYEVTPINLDSRSRKANFVWPRQIAMYLASTITLRSLPDIGRRFGGRDHTTVLHAVRKIEHLVKTKPEIADLINELKEQLNEDHCPAISPDETATRAHQTAV